MRVPFLLSPILPYGSPSLTLTSSIPVPSNPAFPLASSPSSTRVAWGCCALSALLWWVAEQRFGVFALGWVALTPWLWLVAPLSRRGRWRWGWVGGGLPFMLNSWWIVPSIVRGAPVIDIPPALGFVLGVFSLLIIGTGYGAAMGLFCVLWSPSRWRNRGYEWVSPLIFAGGLWFLEWLRCLGPLAHTWGSLAVTQWRDVPLLQTLPFLGQHGLSALCAWFAASLALWLRRGAPVLLWPPLALFALLHLGGALRVALAPPPSRQLHMLLVQTNVSSLRKSGAEAGEKPFNQAYRLTWEGIEDAQNAGRRIDYVLWPETTIEATKDSEASPALGLDAQLVSRLARTYKVHVVVGAGVRTRDDLRYNQAIEFAPDGSQRSSSKEHLVPFGERAPWSEYLPALAQLAPSPPLVSGTKVGGPPVLICFESCFPEPARSVARRDAPYLLVLTNDEWYGGTTAPWEHASMAIIRAAENGVPLAQVANGGYSFVVDRFGRCALNSANFEVFSPYGVQHAYEATLPLR